MASGLVSPPAPQGTAIAFTQANREALATVANESSNGGVPDVKSRVPGGTGGGANGPKQASSVVGDEATILPGIGTGEGNSAPGEGDNKPGVGNGVGGDASGTSSETGTGGNNLPPGDGDNQPVVGSGAGADGSDTRLKTDTNGGISAPPGNGGGQTEPQNGLNEAVKPQESETVTQTDIIKGYPKVVEKTYYIDENGKSTPAEIGAYAQVWGPAAFDGYGNNQQQYDPIDPAKVSAKPSEVTTQTRTIERYPETEDVEEQSIGYEIDYEEKIIKVPTTRVVMETREYKDLVSVIRHVPRKTIEIVQRVIEEEKVVIEMVPVVQLEERITKKTVARVITELVEETVKVPIIRESKEKTTRYKKVPTGTVGITGGNITEDPGQILPVPINSPVLENTGTVSEN